MNTRLAGLIPVVPTGILSIVVATDHVRVTVYNRTFQDRFFSLDGVLLVAGSAVAALPLDILPRVERFPVPAGCSAEVVFGKNIHDAILYVFLGDHSYLPPALASIARVEL